MILFLSFACTKPCSSIFEHGEQTTIDVANTQWTQTALQEGICGPAFIHTANIDDDPEEEILISNFNRPDGFSLPNGFVTSYSYSDLSYTNPISESQGYKWPNDIVPHDMDGDGDLDLLIGFGFLTCDLNPWTDSCGGLAWFEQSADRWKEHVVVEQGSELFYHKALMLDINDDGREDLLAAGEQYFTPFGGIDQGVFQYWLRKEDGSFSEEPTTIVEGLGSIPQLFDIDGDGDEDILSSEYFVPDALSAVWLEQTDSPDPNERFIKHVIDDESGPSIQVEMVSDLFQDGKDYALLSNHSNTEKSNPDPYKSALYLLAPPEDPTTTWIKTPVYDDFASDSSSNQAAPGIFDVGDIDGDGDLDILISGDGDPRIMWMEQVEQEFIPHVLFEDMPQAGVHIADLNQDGQNEMIIGSYELNVVFVLQKGAL